MYTCLKSLTLLFHSIIFLKRSSLRSKKSEVVQVLGIFASQTYAQHVDSKADTQAAHTNRATLPDSLPNKASNTIFFYAGKSKVRKHYYDIKSILLTLRGGVCG